MTRKKGKKKVLEPSKEGALRAMRRRALAAKAFYSSELEELREESISRGAVPYKILCYRRVVEPDAVPFPILPHTYVLPATFELHLQYLAKHCRPLSLGQLIGLLETGEDVPDRSVAVTFDFGHMDTYLNAFPLLLKYRIPATFFIGTGYIESGSFLYDDRVLMMLLIFKETGINMPMFEFLPDSIYEELEAESPDKSVTMGGISLMIQALKSCSQEERAIALGRLGEIALSVLPLPDFEDFMRWNDVRHMQEYGIEFGSMGHFAAGNPTISPMELADDFGISLKVLREQNVEPLPAYCFPPETISGEYIDILGQLNCRWALAETTFPEPRYQTQIPMVLGRIPMFEASSFCTELFACRLWELTISGVQF